MGGLQLSGTELNGVLSEFVSSGTRPGTWINIVCLRGRIMNLDLKLKIPCQIDGLMSGYVLTTDDMTRNHGTAMKGQWTTDIMEASNNDRWRASMIPQVRTDPVWGRARSGLVSPRGWTGPCHLLAVGDWTGLVWTSSNRIIFINFKVDRKQTK